MPARNRGTVTGIHNVYLCTRDYENYFVEGRVYLILGLNQSGRIVDTTFREIGDNVKEIVHIEFNSGEDPFMMAQANNSLIFIGELYREHR